MDNLARDCMMARKLGYSSYGRYKTDYPHTRQLSEQEELDLSGDRVCKGCGKRFFATKPQQRYCTEECRIYTASKKAEERYRAAHPVAMGKCLRCGREFELGCRKKYCSDACREATALEKARAERESQQICPICGEAFVPWHGTKYCSPICRRKAGITRGSERRRRMKDG